MKFYSTENKNNVASLKHAVITGMPSDGGLYMPEEIPQMSRKFFDNLRSMDIQQIGIEITKKFLSDDVPIQEIEQIIKSAMNFDTPLEQVTADIYSLETFHGPSLAFKDVGARFMARLMSYLIRDEEENLNIVVATSGDTGSAVANGFYEVPGINVFVLYPSGKISKIQEKQISTLGKNITALEVNGNFDDCQRLVKTALSDQDLREHINLTTANSINIARLLPQIFYYFRALAQLDGYKDKETIVCVPSGNFGNLTAGLMGKKMGLPVRRFIAATNVNDVVPEYLEKGEYNPRESIETISNAMDVGDPSNFDRILDLYDHDWETIKSDIYGSSYTDEETRATIKSVHKNYNYTCDPHGAVGFTALKDYLEEENGDQGIFLETAHPAKFKQIVENEIEGEVEMPERLAKFIQRDKKSLKIEDKYEEVKEVLLP